MITLPKGGYAPVFKRRETPAPGRLARRSMSAALVTRNTIAVLPFADHSVDTDLDFFCKGLRDELIHHLARIQGLRVLAARGESTNGEAGSVRPSAAIVISGSARRAGDRLRVNLHVIDSASGCYIWSESVDATLSDAFGAQERVAEAVAGKLELELRDGRRRAGFGRPNENLAAKNLYLQGRYHLNQRTDEGLRKSVDFFERAIAEVEEYAPAHAGLADAYTLLAHYGVFGPPEVWTKAASIAASAVMLDATSRPRPTPRWRT